MTNYRSLTKAHGIKLDDSTVLIGRNNEGKSNVLSALNAAMTVVTLLGGTRLRQGRLVAGGRFREVYDWERDFPIQKQDQKLSRESIFRLEFALSDEERAQFKREIGSSLNETLPIEIRIGRADPAFRVVKKGKGSNTLNKKQDKIAAFIGSRVSFTYIPAVRTATTAIEVVRQLVERELRELEKDAEYVRVMDQLAELQSPTLRSISGRVEETLRTFLPHIKAVDVTVQDDSRYRALRRSVDIVVDDGTPTSLERKGDGVQSLVAISLLRGLSMAAGDHILAIEEPEAHLHPGAIHRLREIIRDVSDRHQVIITTHNPLFVDRVHPQRNVLVKGTRATPAKNVKEVRELLGVRASDNLQHAEWVLVVEGQSDLRSLTALLSGESPAIAAALSNSTLVIDHLGGANKLNYKLKELLNALCGVHVALDNDESGRSAVNSALQEQLLREAEYNLLSCPGKDQSELEDLITPDHYSEMLQAEFGVDLAHARRAKSKKWSERLNEAFKLSGKLYTEETVRAVKTRVADLVVAEPTAALHPETRAAFDVLVQSLEKRLGRPSQ